MLNLDFELIAPRCAAFGVPLDSTVRERLTAYAALLVDWNERMNLTAITAPQDILYKHFYDCLLFLKAVSLPQGARIIDVGTGAGFPGMVLKIVRPDLSLTLLDSLAKRLTFLDAVLAELGLAAETVHMRAEDAGRSPVYREQFDFAAARAVAALPVLCEYCLPLVRKGGSFVAMKGQSGADEATAAARAISLLGGAKPNIICETLTGNEQRTFIVIKKSSQTSSKYPRPGGKIAKSAL